MEAVRDRDPETRFEIFSGTPEWVFRDSFLTNYRYHAGAVDVGLVQSGPMEHDLPKTIQAVTGYLNSIPAASVKLAEELKRLDVQAVVCDISPLGIMAGKKAGLPVILFENFTWDWIYEIYAADHPEFNEINRRFREIFSQADIRMQSDPLCDPMDPRPSNVFYVPPVSRRPHHSAEELREMLDIPPENRIGMISMGGIPENLDRAVNCRIPEDVVLLLPGTFSKTERIGNKILLPHHSNVYHPDMVNASDFLIGKAGYSTIGEVCASGAAYGFISRSNFRESEVTSAFLNNRPNTLEISLERFEKFLLNEEIEALLALGKTCAQPVNGSGIAADIILQTLRAA